MKRWVYFFILISGFIAIHNVHALSLSSDQLHAWAENEGFTHDLKEGNTGFSVSILQTYLNSELQDVHLNKKGLFGPVTMAALKEFQTAKGLPVTGLFSDSTRTYIQNDLLAELCPTNTAAPDLLDFPVDRTHVLPEGFFPQALTQIPSTVKTIGIICLDPRALAAYENMDESAHQDGISLIVTSGFRRPEIQSYLTSLYLAAEGTDALRRVAPPGDSEHQLGTAVDLAGPSTGYVSNTFGTTPTGKWLVAHAYEFGFVESFPEGMEAVTGYEYEPWHWRYVGLEIAKQVHDSGEISLKVLQADWLDASTTNSTSTSQ